MNERDWEFAFGDLGNPLTDIKDWMLLPYPQWLKNDLKNGKVPYTKEYLDVRRNSKKSTDR